MADTSYIISGGFFDSVDSDRLYSADDMNMPYKDLVNDGIYKESDGTTPGFAVTASGSMNVLVAPGRALIGGKWGANKEVQTIEIAGNTGGTARIDSIVLQCDRNLDVRAVQLVYRQGGASAPEILTSDGITEFRLANIRVAASASAISSGDITDTRGGTECPWVTSVFDPPDADYILTEYRTDLAGENRTVKAAIDSLQNAAQTGQPAVANQAADMRDTSLVYLYEGSEEGYDAGYLYHYSAVSDQWIRGAQYGASTVDTALSDSSTNAVQNKVVKAAVDQLTDDVAGLNGRLTELEQGGTGGLTADVKAALLACFQNVAWANANGPSSYSALEAALNPPSTLTSISAVYTQSGVVYDSDSLDTLKSNLVVTAHYSDSTSEVVSGYALSGTLTEGTSTITVTYGGKTTTFTVNVTTVWSYDIDDLTMATGAMVGAASANAGVALAISTTNRRSFFVDDGSVSVAIQQANQITSQTSEYYPVKVPEGATGVTVSITPSTQYVAVYLYELTNGKYTSVTASGDSGYTVGSHTKTWTAAPDNYYILITTKYDNAGSSYPVEPTGLDIAFAR